MNRNEWTWAFLAASVCGVAITWCAASTRAAEDANGFQPIFDGQTLKDWDGDPKFWRVEDGTITGQTTPENPTKGNTFLIWRGGEPGDFELRLQFKIVGGNSGIQYRSRTVDKWVLSGYQADIDSGDRFIGILYEEQARGILALRGKKVVISEDGTLADVGETADDATILGAIKKEGWNEYSIRAEGNHLVQKINGHTTVDVTDNEAAKRTMDGLIGLQLHAGPPMTVQFKDIQLKQLGPAQDDQASTESPRKKVVFVAGKPSHGYGSHEHNAGCLLLAHYLKQNLPGYDVDVHRNGWPATGVAAFEGADAVVVYCDGGAGHLLLPHIQPFDEVMKRGVGLVCLHYGVEVPKSSGGEAFLNWIGGYFETDWSVNPHWTANFETLPDHPITRGVQPFAVNDEWYFHMRFRPQMEHVTPILSAVPPATTMNREDGPHSGNPTVRAAVARQQSQHVAWAAERPDGGRGFGFTGGHYHWNWGDDNFRRLVLNAIAWAAHDEVPTSGVGSATPTQDELEKNQDYPKPAEQARKKKANQDHRLAQRDKPLAEATHLVAATNSRAPATAVENLVVHPQLEATLFAAEPMLLSPSNIDVDDRGRIWVCEIVNYRSHRGRRPAGDRILILEDADGDGQVDREKVFYQGTDIDSPHGVCVLGNQVIVSAGSHVFCFTDSDGDDKPDKKEVWFSGIDGVQHDHGIHAFVFGPDGKLYFNFGNEGKQLRDAKGKPIIDLAGNEVAETMQPYQQGMVFRCDSDLSNLETLGWNFRNNWMVTVDSFGAIWQSDNDDDGNQGVRINYVMEFGNYGYRDERTGAGWRTERIGMADDVPSRHWHLNDPGVVPNVLQTGGGSPTGITVYEGDALPKQFQGQLIHCDAGPSVTRAYRLSDDGAGYSAEIENILQGARDNWFRPSDVKVAPDGSLIVADWYDPGVGGHAMGDLERGRLFRVTRKGQGSAYRVPTFDFSSVAGAIAALQNPNYSVRYLAWQALHAMGAAAEPALFELSQHEQPHLRARALWLLGKIGGRDQQTVNQAAADADARIRMLAVRLARQLPQVDPLDLVAQLVHDTSPQVRRECLIALRHSKDVRAPQLWAVLATQYDGQDRWYLEALGIAADAQWDRFLDAWMKESGAAASNLAAKVTRDIWWRSRGSQTPDRLIKILISKETPADEVPRFLRAFDFLPSEQSIAAAETLAFETQFNDEDRAKLVRAEALARLDTSQVSDSEPRKKQLSSILDSIYGTQQFINLVRKFDLQDRMSSVVDMAISNPDQSEGVDAARMALDQGQGRRFADRFAAADNDGKTVILQLLGRTSTNNAIPVMASVMNNEKLSLELRSEAVRNLAKIRGGADYLVKRTDDGQIPGELHQVTAASLHRAQWSDVRQEANRVYPISAAKDNKPLPSIAELSTHAGDAERGQVVFAKAGTCASCHIVKGEGKAVGPDLSEIGKKLSRDAMFESILYPSAGISHNFESYVAQTVDGNTVLGLLASETADFVEIKNIEGITQRIDRKAIEVLAKQTVSLMPADLHKNLTEQELVDVVDYMMTLK